MKRTDKQKEQLLKDLWYSRNPCHDNDQEGNDRFWGTALCVFDDYQKALTIPVVVSTSNCEHVRGGLILRNNEWFIECRKCGELY